MFPRQRLAGLAGILAGVGLGIEFTLFMASGWTPEAFADPEAALHFLEVGGRTLRAAAFVGFLNLALVVLFIAGLAGTLRRGAPTRAAALLYLGLIGVAAHALVPLGLWLGPPGFLELAATRPGVALGAWAGFAAFLDAAGGVGYLFDGAAFVSAGAAILTVRRLPRGLAWAGMLGGGASALTILARGTPLAVLSSVLYIPSLVLIITFRLWGGISLWREAPENEG